MCNLFNAVVAVSTGTIVDLMVKGILPSDLSSDNVYDGMLEPSEMELIIGQTVPKLFYNTRSEAYYSYMDVIIASIDDNYIREQDIFFQSHWPTHEASIHEVLGSNALVNRMNASN